MRKGTEVSVRTVTTRRELCDYPMYDGDVKTTILEMRQERGITSLSFFRVLQSVTECWDRICDKLLVRNARVIRARVQQDLRDIQLIKERLAMRRGRRIKRGKSKRSFTKGAQRVHKKNIRDRPMRGGIRL